MTPDELLPRVYAELRRLGAADMRMESLELALNATALLHEVLLTLKSDE